MFRRICPLACTAAAFSRSATCTIQQQTAAFSSSKTSDSTAHFRENVFCDVSVPLPVTEYDRHHEITQYDAMCCCSSSSTSSASKSQKTPVSAADEFLAAQYANPPRTEDIEGNLGFYILP